MMKKKQLSASAKALADRKYYQRIVLAKKGRGSYNRKKAEKVYA
jgi:stalled ribosome alternative rescue factor ArfA